jgi:hypothetical protein
MPFCLFPIRINLELWNLTVGLTPWTGDQPHRKTGINAQGDTNSEDMKKSMCRMQFEPTVPMFDRAANIISYFDQECPKRKQLLTISPLT